MKQVHLFADARQVAAWHAAAEADGRTLSSWIRFLLDERCRIVADEVKAELDAAEDAGWPMTGVGPCNKPKRRAAGQ